MRALQKLVRNGNATAVSIPRAILFQLGWLPAQAIIVEITESGDALIVRRPKAEDFGPIVAPRVVAGGGQL